MKMIKAIEISFQFFFKEYFKSILELQLQALHLQAWFH